jgi:hypothetical protein
MLQPVKNMDEYKRIKEALRNKFETERTGDQHLFIEQSKLLEPLIRPLISTQEQAVKAIEANAARSSAIDPPRSVLTLPVSDSTLSRPEARRSLRSLPEEEPIKIDLDSGFDEIGIRNLQDMNFDLPSEVFKNKQIEKTISKIKSQNRRIGQKLGRGSDATEEQKQIYKSWKKTLELYRQKIHGLEGAKQFVGKGVRTDVIFYPSVEDLCSRLTELDAAKRAGNTGLDDRINSVLDELLRTRAISKDEYDALYKLIFI